MEINGLSLNQARDAAEMAATVAAASEVGVFAALAAKPATANELADRLGLNHRAARILLPALADMGALRQRDGGFEVPEDVRRELVDSDSADYVAGGLPLWLRNVRTWTRLPDALRTGLPQREESGEDPQEELRHFMAGMAAAPVERVRRLVQACLARHPDARTMLDLGGGPGHIAREFVRAGLEATLFDRPETVDFVAEEYGLKDQPGMHLARGDFTVDPLPAGPFDVVLLSNVTHIYSPDQNLELLRKVHVVLAPGGLLAIGDFVRGYTPRGSRFALVMLLRTERGNVYGEAEYREWLARTGFGDARFEDVDVDRQLITALCTP